MLMDVNRTYCGHHFTLYTHIGFVHFTPDTNIMLCQLHLNKKIENEVPIVLVLPHSQTKF